MSILREAAAAESPASGWHPDGNAGWPGCCGGKCVSVKQTLLGRFLDAVMPMCTAGQVRGLGRGLSPILAELSCAGVWAKSHCALRPSWAVPWLCDPGVRNVTGFRWLFLGSAAACSANYNVSWAGFVIAWFISRIFVWFWEKGILCAALDL